MLPHIMRSAPLPFRQEAAFLNEFLQAQLHGAGLALGECVEGGGSDKQMSFFMA